MSLSFFFFFLMFIFVKFSYWFKFHVNIITGSGVATIFVYKELTRNPERGNLPSKFCPVSGDYCKLKDTTFDRNVSNKKLLNPAKWHV